MADEILSSVQCPEIHLKIIIIIKDHVRHQLHVKLSGPGIPGSRFE
jgi:hypothetical protein